LLLRKSEGKNCRSTQAWSMMMHTMSTKASQGDHLQRRLHSLVEVVAALSPDLEEQATKLPEQDGHREEQVEHHLATGLLQQEGHWNERVEQGDREKRVE
jgi:hypothetical protein